ncbi:MAG: hypothetical protein ACK4UK_04965 [Flavobacterium sp.]
MKFKLGKPFFYDFLLALCIIVPYVNVFELTMMVWGLTMLLTLKKKYSFSVIQFIIPLVLVFLISFFSGIFEDYILYNKIRDIAYLLKPIIGILLGYQLCRAHQINPMKTLINIGLIIAVYHLIQVVYGITFFRIRHIHDLRYFAGYFSDYEAYALVILMFHKRFGITYTQKQYLLYLAILGSSVLFYMSRTNFLQVGILAFGILGYYKLSTKSIKIVSIFVLGTILVYSALFQMNLSRNGSGLEALLFKIKNAPIEAFKTKVNKHNWQDFNDNFRSYENIITVRQVEAGGTLNVLFGKGVGSTVDYGLKMLTNDGTYIRHAPILHNAYATIFLKSGLLGLLISFYFLTLFWKKSNHSDEVITSLDKLFVASGVFLILANWVLLGIYLKLDNKAIIFGYLLAYRHYLISNQKVNEK